MNFLIAFIAWTASSYTCYRLAKAFLVEVVACLPYLQPACAATILTGVHVLLCWLMTKTSLETQPSSATSFQPLPYSSAKQGLSFHFAMALNVLAIFLTSWSLATMETASTLAIRLMEPLTSAMVQWAWLGQRQACGTWVSLPLVAIGVLTFLSDKSGRVPDEHVTSLVLALGANVLLAVRNLVFKGLHSGHLHVRPRRFEWSYLGLLVGSLGGVLLAMSLLQVTRRSALMLMSLLLSGVFRVTCSLISTCVILRELNVMSHAMANVIKRVLVVALLYVSVSRSASGVNAVGLAVAAVGLAVYVKSKAVDNQKQQHRKAATNIAKETLLVRRSARCRPATFVTFALVTCSFVLLVSSLKAPLNVSTYLYQLPPVLRRASACCNERNAGAASAEALHYDANQRASPFGLNWPGPPRNVAIFSHWAEFLSRDYYSNDSFHTNSLALDLRMNDDVIWEMQRLQMSVMATLLGDRRHVMLMGFATSENKGDSAITVGEMALLRQLNVTVVFCCEMKSCQDSRLQVAKNISRLYSPASLAILMHGGGNLVGYSFADYFRQKVLYLFPDFPSVVLSQSIWLYPGNAAHLNKCKEIYSHRPNLTIFLRDKQSLGLAQEHFKGTKLMLMPDMAFGLGRVPRTMPPTHDIVWLKRGDHESSRYAVPPLPANLNVHLGDWWTWTTNQGNTSMETALLMAFNGMSFLQRGRVVITDRLHGHILSVLLGIPHVLIDNPPYFKLSSFRRTWTAGLPNTVLVTSGDEALVKAQELLQKYDSSLPAVMPCLKELCQVDQ